MKFSRTRREQGGIFYENYNPGPGFYLGNDQRYSSILKYSHSNYGGQDQTVPFPREMRFRKLKNQNDAKVGPGSYNFKSQFLNRKEYLEKFNINPTIQKLNYSNTQSSFKVNAVPSIPSGNISGGYQDIGDGLVIQLKDNNKNLLKNRVGPGSYDPKIEMIKPRKQVPFIRSQSNFTKIKELPQLNLPDFYVFSHKSYSKR
ncbi:hypothetical protein ABPG72_011877 [Tetrahymena utriculariae]